VNNIQQSLKQLYLHSVQSTFSHWTWNRVCVFQSGMDFLLQFRGMDNLHNSGCFFILTTCQLLSLESVAGVTWDGMNQTKITSCRCCSVSHICSSLYFPLLVSFYFYGKYNLTQRRAVFLRKPWRKSYPRRPSCRRGARPSLVRSW